MEVAVGVLIPNHIQGEHNEIIDIWVNGYQHYYYQSELTEQGVKEGLYCGEGIKVDDEDEETLYEELEDSKIKLFIPF